MRLGVKILTLTILSTLTIRAIGEPPVADTPPMGWNSWDCYGASVRENEVRANAQYMAKSLKKFGWKYVVVDIQWYEPTADSNNYHPNAKLEMDANGRLLPAPNRFPSAAGGKGFKPLAEYVHGLGLKFGIHILRGIPRQAVQQRTPILGTTLTAANVADTVNVCGWNTDMFGVDATKDGSQAWYDSNFKLYASWGVDYVKVDDLTQPYHKGEIEEIRKAIDGCGRPMVFSASPGPTPLDQADRISKFANAWRVSGDVWDRWDDVNAAFMLAEDWNKFCAGGHWPDLDMLPLGHIGIRSQDGDRKTRLTPDEQQAMLTLWCIARSPLIFGGNLPDNDPATEAMLTNANLLAVLNDSYDNRMVRRAGDMIMWQAGAAKGGFYIAVFNLGKFTSTMKVSFAAFGLPGALKVKDLWSEKGDSDTGPAVNVFVHGHGARLFWLRSIGAKKRSTLGNILLGPFPGASDGPTPK